MNLNANPAACVRGSVLPIVLLAACLAAGCDREAGVAPKPAQVPLRTAEVGAVEGPEWLATQGVALRRDATRLSFKIGGVLEQVAVRGGDRVVCGQVLARLRADEIDAEVARAESLLAEARRGLVRAERLAGDGVVAVERAEDARTGVETAEAAVAIARFNRDFSVITAPADGVVLGRLAEPDELVAPGQAVLGFAAEAAGWVVRAEVSDRVASRLEAGGSAEIGDRRGRRVEARLGRVEASVDPVTRLVRIELEVPEAPEHWVSGAPVDVRLRAVRETGLARIPAAAVVRGRGDRVEVFAVGAGGVLELQSARVERLDEPGGLVVSGGPAVGMRVVTGGVDRAAGILVSRPE